MNQKQSHTICYAGYNAAQYRHSYVQVVTRVLGTGQPASCVTELPEVYPLEWIV